MVRSATSLSDATGVTVRHAAFSGVSSTQAGRRTRRNRAAQPPPTAEAKLLYAMALQLRLGYARALDAPEGGRGYLVLGRAF